MCFLLWLSMQAPLAPTTLRVAISAAPGSEAVEGYVRERLASYGAAVVGDDVAADLMLRLEVADEGRVVAVQIIDRDGAATREVSGVDVDEARALTWLVVRGALDRAALRTPVILVPEPPTELVPPPPVVVQSPVVPPPVVAAPSPSSSVRWRGSARAAPGVPGVLPLPAGFAAGVDVGDTFALGVEAGWQVLLADDVVVHELPVSVRAEWRVTAAAAVGARAGFGPAIGVGSGKGVGVGVGVGASLGAYARWRLPVISQPLPVALALEVGVDVRPLRSSFTTNSGALLSDVVALPLSICVELDPPAAQP